MVKWNGTGDNMNRYERRKLKANIYKHSNTITYGAIFVIAGVITIAAAMNRTDKIMYVDQTQIASTNKEAVDIKNSATQKVAASETNTEQPADIVTDNDFEQPVETVTETAAEQTQAYESENVHNMENKVKVTADTLKVRAAASTDAEVLGMADMDDVFDVVSESSGWTEINYNGVNGFISSEFVETIE